MSRRLWTPGEVAEAFRVDVKTVGRWAKNGRIPADAVKNTPGGHRRFRDDEMRRLLDWPSAEEEEAEAAQRTAARRAQEARHAQDKPQP